MKWSHNFVTKNDKIVRVAILLCFLSVVASSACWAASQPFVTISGGGWHYTPHGTARENGVDYNISRDLNLDTTTEGYFGLGLDSHVPWLPRLAVRYVRFHDQGTSPDSGAVPALFNSEANVRDLQYRLSYPLVESRLSLYAGAAVEYLHGMMTVHQPVGTSENVEDVNRYFPMPYMTATLGLAGWLKMRAQGGYIAARGDEADEWRAGLEVSPVRSLSLEAGYWRKHYQFEVSGGSFKLDTTLQGPFAGLRLSYY